MRNRFLSRIRIYMTCPPHQDLASLLTYVLCASILYLCLYSVVPSGSFVNCTTSKPKICQGGNFFSLFVIFITALIAGSMMIPMKLPQLLGMTIMGFVLKNTSYLDVVINFDVEWSASLRKIALTIILIKYGISLDLQILRSFTLIVLRISFIPCLVEALITTILSHFLLSLPWKWSFIMGFIQSAICPSVVVPTMLKLENKGYGCLQGLNTLITTVTCMDNIFSITFSGLAIAFLFAPTSNIALIIFRGPIETLIGIFYGTLIGSTLWFLPSKDNDHCEFFRCVLIFMSAFAIMFASTTFKIPGAGPLGVITLAFVASIRWRKEIIWKDKENTLVQTIDTLWWVFQPFLFGLLGAGLNVKLFNKISFGFMILTIITSLMFRVGSCFLVLYQTDFNYKERIFICMSWISKGTIQAALGPLALEFLSSTHKDLIYGQLIVAISVLSIIITTPLAVSLMFITAPKLLQRRMEMFEKVLEFKEATAETQRLYTEVPIGDGVGELSIDHDYNETSFTN